MRGAGEGGCENVVLVVEKEKAPRKLSAAGKTRKGTQAVKAAAAAAWEDACMNVLEALLCCIYFLYHFEF